jgi:hypothetical protein
VGPARHTHLGRRLQQHPRRDEIEGPPADRLFPAVLQYTAVGGARSAIRCGLDFLWCGSSPMFIRETIAALEDLALAEDERAAIYFRNALHMMKMEVRS